MDIKDIQLVDSTGNAQDETVYETRTVYFMGEPVRIVEKGGEPEFHIGDVYGVLGLKNSRDAVKILGDHGVDKIYIMSRYGNEPERKRLQNFCDEVGLYQLTWRSNSPKAKEFARDCARFFREYRQKGYVAAPGSTFQIDEKRYQLEAAEKCLKMMQDTGLFKDNILQAFAIDVAEKHTGMNLLHLKPKNTHLYNLTMGDIAYKLSSEGYVNAKNPKKQVMISHILVGRAVTLEGLRKNVEGYSEIYETEKSHSKGSVPAFRFTEDGAARIRERLLSEGWIALQEIRK